MSNSKIFIALLIAIQLAQVLSGSGFYFDTSKARAYMAAGNCYLYPGLSNYGSSGSGSFSSSSGIRSSSSLGSTGSGSTGIRYYNLPSNWRQFEDKIVIPNLMSNRGSYNFGAKAIYGSN